MSIEASISARIAAHESWAATENRTARTEPGRAAMRAKFEAEADPNGILTPAARAQKAESLRKAHFSRLALRSVAARRKAKELLADAARSERELADLADLDDLSRRLTELGL